MSTISTKKNIFEYNWCCLELDWVAISNRGDGVEFEEQQRGQDLKENA